MRTKLERLSVDDLKKLALACDIRFEGGIDSLKDREQADVKEQIILVLDETEPALLQKEYTRLIKSTWGYMQH